MSYPFEPVTIVNIPAGIFLVSASMPIPSNTIFQGAGRGVTILRAAPGLGGGIFSQVVPSGQSLVNVMWRDLTLDGNTGPTGSNVGILINTNASNSIPYYNMTAQNVDFINCLFGWQHSANNGSGTALFNETLCLSCRFYNNGVGAILRGVYASTFSECLFAGNTVNHIGTSGYNGTPVITGTDPATSIAVRNCHFEGLGNQTGGGSATDSGVSLNCTQYAITACYFSNISLYPVFCQDNEGLGSVIDGLRIWGCGGPALILDQPNAVTGFTAVSNIACSQVSQNAGLNASFGQKGVISVVGGQASITNVTVAAFGTAPPYALNLGANGAGKVGVVDVSQFHCPSPSVSWLLVNNAQASMVLKIRNSTGFNPAGSQVIAVPATTVATAALTFDATFYVTAAAGGGVTLAIQGGPTVTVPASAVVPVFVPAGKTLTPTYTSAPTWVVEGN